MTFPLHKFRSLAAVASAALLLTTASACSIGSSDAHAADKGSSGTVVLRLPDPGNSGALALGKKDGSLAAALAKVRAKVQWTGSAGAFAPAAQELDGNQLDIAEGSITSASAALAQSPGFKLFAAVAPDETGEGILVKDSSGIKTVKDLIGKKVAVWHGGTAEYLLLKALDQAGVPVAKVDRVYLAPDQSAAVLHTGQVDAWATWAQFAIPELGKGEHFLVDGGQVGSQNYAVWAVRNGFLTAHPDVVKAFYDYVHEAEVKQAQDPSRYVNVFRTSGPDAVTGKALTLTEQNLGQSRPTSAITAADRAAFAQVVSFFTKAGVLPSAIDLTPYLVDVTTLGNA